MQDLPIEERYNIHGIADEVLRDVQEKHRLSAGASIALRDAIARELRIAWSDGRIVGQKEIIAIYKD